MNDGFRSNLLWWVIPDVLAGMPMPFIHPERRMNHGGALNDYDDELPVLYSSGVRAVVSLLNIPSDALVYDSAGFSFLCLAIADGHPPTMEQTDQFVRLVDEQRGINRAVAVHCEGGIGRTGTMLAAYLIRHGKSAKEAIATVRSVETSAIETARQIQFLEFLDDQIKNKTGTSNGD
jgi:atypical dual specificity phosphatase